MVNFEENRILNLTHAGITIYEPPARMYDWGMKTPIHILTFCAVIGIVSGVWICEKAADVFNYCGFERSMTGDTRGAIWCYDQAILLNPRHSSAYVNRGQSKRSIGDNAHALTDCDQAIRFSNSSGLLSWAHALRGECKSELGMKSEAIEDFSKALELDSAISANILLERARVRTEIGDRKNAAKDYYEFIALTCDQAGCPLNNE